LGGARWGVTERAHYPVLKNGGKTLQLQEKGG